MSETIPEEVMKEAREVVRALAWMPGQPETEQVLAVAERYQELTSKGFGFGFARETSAAECVARALLARDERAAKEEREALLTIVKRYTDPITLECIEQDAWSKT